jgi:Domain of unknown function (DUF4384)
VTNGISCMGCHDQGMRKAKDEVRAIVLSGRAFQRDTREAVEALYPPHEKMDRVIDDDAKRFADALTRAGLEPTLKFNGVEMINALAKRYEDDVDATLAAAELGLSKAEFAKRSADADRRFKPLIRRLEQGLVPRDQFEAFFVELATDITDDEVVKVVKVAGVAGRPAKAAYAAELSLTSDKDTYQQGDGPTFTILSARECFLTLTNVDEKGEGTVLFPNRFQQDNRIRPNVEVALPGANAPFQYRMKDKGVETVIAVCTEGNKGVDGIKHDFTRSAFTSVPNYTRSVARSIAVEPKGPTPSAAPARPAKAAGAGAEREISRAAIKINVR